MTFVTKPSFVKFKDLIKSEDINKIIQGLIDIEDYLEKIIIPIPFQLQHGKIENIPTDESALLKYVVTFDKPFTDLPRVFLSIEEMNIKVDIKPLWITDLSKTGFTLNIFVLKGEKNTFINVNWLALL